MIAESVLASDVSSAKAQAGREEGSPPAIRLRRVSRNFSGIQAVDGVDLEVQQGEFFTLLGPSGSGKTTCLRMIAGFEVKLLAVQPNPGLNLQQLPEGTEVTLSWDPSRMHRIPE